MHISSTFNVEDLTIYLGHYQDESFEGQAIRLPMAPAPREEIEDVFDDQPVSKKNGGCHKFLVKWKGGPFSKATWITAIDFQRFNPDLYERYQADNSPESSFSKPGRVYASQAIGPPLNFNTQRSKPTKAQFVHIYS